MASHRHAGKKAGRGHKRAAPQRVAVHASKPKKKASKYHHRGMHGLGGTQEEHAEHAKDTIMMAAETVKSAEKSLRDGDCQRAHQLLHFGSGFVGRAEAHFDEASRNQGPLFDMLYDPASGLAVKLNKIADNFASRCVIKK